MTAILKSIAKTPFSGKSTYGIPWVTLYSCRNPLFSPTYEKTNDHTQQHGYSEGTIVICECPDSEGVILYFLDILDWGILKNHAGRYASDRIKVAPS
jgi:hypothetical protein